MAPCSQTEPDATGPVRAAGGLQIGATGVDGSPEGQESGAANAWLLWQLADSAFPTGGFAHSGGLEAAWQHGELRSGADLASFIEASLCQWGRGSLPFMTAAFENPDRFNELDCLCDCFTTNHVANRASRRQGQAWLSSAQRIFARPKLEPPCGFDPPQPPCCHLAPIFGVVMRELEIDRDSGSRLFCFLHLRGLVTSAVRLGVVGPLEAQALQYQMGGCAEEILARCRRLSVEDIAQTAPLIDLWQGTHDRLYSRLFQS
ncbi:MAG: urease accessory protein UreF [Limisphaerales bacterium]